MLDDLYLVSLVRPNGSQRFARKTLADGRKVFTTFASEDLAYSFAVHALALASVGTYVNAYIHYAGDVVRIVDPAFGDNWIDMMITRHGHCGQ